jgi:hypothetical protein
MVCAPRQRVVYVVVSSAAPANVFPLTSVAPTKRDVGHGALLISVNAAMGYQSSISQVRITNAVMVCVPRRHVVCATADSVRPANA